MYDMINKGIGTKGYIKGLVIWNNIHARHRTSAYLFNFGVTYPKIFVLGQMIRFRNQNQECVPGRSIHVSTASTEA